MLSFIGVFKPTTNDQILSSEDRETQGSGSDKPNSESFQNINSSRATEAFASHRTSDNIQAQDFEIDADSEDTISAEDIPLLKKTKAGRVTRKTLNSGPRGRLEGGFSTKTIAERRKERAQLHLATKKIDLKRD